MITVQRNIGFRFQIHITETTISSFPFGSFTVLWWTDSPIHRIIAYKSTMERYHDDVITWKHFPRYWSFCEGNPVVTGWFLSQRQVTRSFDVFFGLRLNKRLSKQSIRCWFETPSRSLWCHCNISQRFVPNSFRAKLISYRPIFLFYIIHIQPNRNSYIMWVFMQVYVTKYMHHPEPIL